jgi:DEAD/DEAH box helicase domain-containing protein
MPKSAVETAEARNFAGNHLLPPLKLIMLRDLLASRGLVAVEVVQPGRPAARSGLRFRNFLPTLCRRGVEFCDWEMYEHQRLGLKALLLGSNLLLSAETGGGKTEVWVGYALEMIARGEDFKALVVYPTKALTGDQQERICRYARQAGLDAVVEERGGVRLVRGDVLRYDGDVSRYVKDYMIKNAKIVLTNPEILHLAVYHGHKIEPFLRQTKLIVLDEFDFYGSSKASLLLHLVDLLAKKYGTRPQLVIMSATLSGSSHVARILNAKTVEGAAYRPENHMYFVLGEKLIGELCRRYGIECGGLEEARQLAIKCFRERSCVASLYAAYRMMYDVLPQALADVVKAGAPHSGTTLIFTNTINEAERLSRALAELGVECSAHHHLVPRGKRHKIEKMLREGSLGCVVTVKTLMQGIDIGLITRVVHVGLPPDVKSFIQREGRKGRREEIATTESIIFLTSPSELRIAADFSRWVEGGPEVLVYTPHNEFLTLHDVCGEMLRDPAKAQQRHAEFIQRLNLTQRDCKRLRFYSPAESGQIGVVVAPRDEALEERIPWRDYVEYLQPGSLDPSTGAVVLRLIKSGEDWYLCEVSTNALKNLWDVPFTCRGNPVKIPAWLNEALYKYQDFCRRLPPDERGGRLCDLKEFAEDVGRGKVWSKVATDLLFGQGGFVRGKVVPRAVYWYVESRKLHPVKIGDEVVYSYVVEKIEVYEPKKPQGYELFTYAYAVELDPNDLAWVDRAMLFLLAVLRKRFRIDTNLIRYCPSWGNLLKIWEAEPVGLLKELREMRPIEVGGQALTCETLRRAVEEEELDEYMKMLIEKEEPEALHGVSEEELRRAAARFVYYLCDAVPAKIKDAEIPIPKTPPNIVAVDQFGDAFYVHDTEKSTEHPTAAEALQEAVRRAADKFAEAVVYFGEDKKLQETRLPPWINRNAIINLAKELEEHVEGPLSLTSIRREIFGKTDLLELELAINQKTQNLPEVKTSVEYHKLLRIRFETMAWLYNLYKRLTS